MKRLCWHCNGPLSPMGHATVTIEPGRNVKVHKVCANAAKQSVRRVTAAPPPDGEDVISRLLDREYEGRQ